MCWSSLRQTPPSLLPVIGAGALASLASAAMAAEHRAAITATTGLSVAKNPYLSTESKVRALIADLSVHPVLSSKTETSTAALSGTLGYRHYSNGLEPYFYGDGLASASIQTSARLTMNGELHYRQENSSESVEDTAGAIDPESIRRAFGGSLSAAWRMSEYTSLAPSLAVESVSYDRSDTLEEYVRTDAGLAVTRRVSSRTTVGVSGAATRFIYPDTPDADILSASATISHLLSEHLTLNGAIGVERSNFTSKGESGDSRDARISLVGNGSLCRRGEYSNLCATASLSSEPSGFGTVEKRLSGGVTYDIRLGEFSRLALDANYQRSSDLNALEQGDISLLQASASFDRQITDFLTLNTFVEYRRRDGFDSASSAHAGVNLRWKAGRE